MDRRSAHLPAPPRDVVFWQQAPGGRLDAVFASDGWYEHHEPAFRWTSSICWRRSAALMFAT
jgi:hypothetical protein